MFHPHHDDHLQHEQGTRHAVRLPAVCIAVLCVVDLLAIGITEWRFPAQGVTALRALELLHVIVTPVVLYGALRMYQLRSYRFVKLTALLAAIPLLGPCLILGTPVGVWALVVLSNPHVEASFES